MSNATTHDADIGLDIDDVLQYAPSEVIDDRYEDRFLELVRHYAEDFLHEATATPEGSDPDAAQRRVVRGASYSAFRQLWSEVTNG